MARPSGALHPVAPGLYAWLSEPKGKGHPNAGVIVDADGLTLVDTLMVPSQYDAFGAAIDAWRLPIKRVVLTSSHIDLCGGTARFWMAACYGSQLTSDQLDLPANVDGYRCLMPELADEFPDDLRTRPVSHLITSAARITDAAVVLPTRGQMAENLVVHVPGADTVFTGAMASFGVTPLVFDGDPARWADELDQLAELASIFVPAYGPVGTADDVRALSGYLRACVAADGDPAAVQPGPWDDWVDRRFDAVNAERASMLARGETAPPPSMLALLGLR